MRTPDPTLSDLLDEPIVRAMMAADAVDSDAIRILSARVRHSPHTGGGALPRRGRAGSFSETERGMAVSGEPQCSMELKG